MTFNNTVIFRRFDEVHVQLLLFLQDEITQLEQQLRALDGSGTTSAERTPEKARVLREMAKVVSEYGKSDCGIFPLRGSHETTDNMFSSWSQMQHQKASKATTQSLKQWLERPTIGPGGGPSESARDDLKWLEASNDLSSVSLKASARRRGRGAGESVSNSIRGVLGGCVGRGK